LANPLILILLFASGLSAWSGEIASFIIIVAIIFLSVVLDLVQQYHAEHAVDALRCSVGLRTLVVRDAEAREIAVEHLVPRRRRAAFRRRHRSGRLPPHRRA
jgi:Mg2+-importing ATPase